MIIQNMLNLQSEWKKINHKDFFLWNSNSHHSSRNTGLRLAKHVLPKIPGSLWPKIIQFLAVTLLPIPKWKEQETVAKGLGIYSFSCIGLRLLIQRLTQEVGIVHYSCYKTFSTDFFQSSSNKKEITSLFSGRSLLSDYFHQLYCQSKEIFFNPGHLCVSKEKDCL